MDILLIEPDKLLGDIYKKALKKQGLKIELCNSAQMSVNSLDRHTPKLIILEIQLAEHNGIEFLYELRSHQDWKYIPVIINSLIPAEEIGLNADLQKELGIETVLYKPRTKLGELLEYANRSIKVKE
jgi:DNA-binding response OmpR family regulator